MPTVPAPIQQGTQRDSDGDVQMQAAIEMALIARALGEAGTVSEIFPPPRVTKHASTFGFKPGLSCVFILGAGKVGTGVRTINY